MNHEWRGMLFLTIMLLGAAFCMVVASGNAEAQERYPHNPIDIRSDAEFASPSSGVTGGSGTEEDPYIIENWEISSSSVDEIHIEDTQSHVIIRNVLADGDGGVDHDGIEILNAEHVTIEDCEVIDDRRGIRIGSSTVSLKNNTLNDNDYGLSLDFGSRESIPLMEGNLVNGINIDGTTTEDEQCYYYNEEDLVIDGRDERCDSGGYSGGLTSQGLITLYNCDNFSIRNCTLMGNAIGIFLGHSNGTILNNTIENNTWGFAIECRSSSPQITGNHISFNGWGGIYCNGGSSPCIRDNQISNNTSSTGYGIQMMDADSNPIIENNTISGHRPHDGIWVDEGSTPIVRNNLIIDNLEGIAIQRRSGGIFENNTIKGNDIGIFTGTGSTPLIRNNLITDNIRGIHCPNGQDPNEDTLIINNTISNNRDEGIFCFYSSNPQIRMNLLSENDIGICCRRDADPEICNNSIFNNRRGIVVEGRNSGDNHYPSRPVTHDNDLVGNIEYGVYNDDDGDNANLDENGEQVIIDAENNWWNASNGPSGNGSGDGDNVSAYVDYDPWSIGPSGSNHVPSIEIVEPREGEEISGICVISGEASDPDGNDELRFVEIRIDNGEWEEANGTTSWSQEWNTTEVEDGNHTIHARAFDGLDYSETIAVNITVKNAHENIEPNITIDGPGEGDMVTGTCRIDGTASDEDGKVHKVEVRIDDGDWMEAEGTLNWSFDWDTTAVGNGGHTIFARAFDGVAHSNVTWVNVTVDNEEPVNHRSTVAITGPQDGETVDGNITITGTASDEDGDVQIEKIEVRIDDGGWWTAEGTTSWTFDIDTIAYDNGTHTVSVRAFDGEDYSLVASITLEFDNVNDSIPSENSVPEILSLVTDMARYETGDTLVLDGEIEDADGVDDIVDISIVVYLVDGASHVEVDDYGMADLAIEELDDETIAFELSIQIVGYDAGYYLVQLEIEDSGGETDLDEIYFMIEGSDSSDDSDDKPDIFWLIVVVIITVLALVGFALHGRARGATVEIVEPIETSGMASPAVPCPRCGGATQYVVEYWSHYCWECEEYVGEMEERGD